MLTRTSSCMGALLLCIAGVAMAADESSNQTPSQKMVNDKVAKASKSKRMSKVVEQQQPVSTPSAEGNKLPSNSSEVHTGRMVCELGNSVTVTPDPQVPGSFVLQMRQLTYHMTPVVSSTGAVRLEDAKAGAMWLQLANKSMLMNSKIGQRMADECQSPAQQAEAEAMKLSPPLSLLDTPVLARK